MKRDRRYGGHAYVDTERGRLWLDDTIRDEGPGGGFASVPWALARYGRVLRLRPGEMWLLERLIQHHWTEDDLPHLSFRKLAQQACVSRETLKQYRDRLLALGYIERVEQPARRNGAYPDRRVYYRLDGLWLALAICIALDPCSKWAERNAGPITLAEARGIMQNCKAFDLDVDALETLAERRGEYVR